MNPLELLANIAFHSVDNLHLNPVINFLHPTDPAHIFPALKISEGERRSTEVIEKRRPHSKTFKIGANEFKTVMSHAIIHYGDEGKMEEVDLRIVDHNGKKLMVKAPYKVEVFTDRVGYRLDQPDGTFFTIELVKIAGVEVNYSSLKSTVHGCQMFWDDLLPDLAFKVLLRDDRPIIYTALHSPLAPRSFSWKITHQGDFDFESIGFDHEREALQIKVSKQRIRNDVLMYTEEWTGLVSRKDKKTRIRKWYNDPVYPVIIDPTATINIAANSDDGMGYMYHKTNSWVSNSIRVGPNWGAVGTCDGGFRFQNVGIPSGASVSSATLKTKAKAVFGGSPANIKIWGDKVANAAVWANASQPKNVTKTTLSTTWTPTINVLNSVDVTNQVAEIVGLGGWASNNAMRFAGLSGTAGSARFIDHNTDVPNSSTLVIVYTVGGSASPRHGDMNFMGI